MNFANKSLIHIPSFHSRRSFSCARETSSNSARLTNSPKRHSRPTTRSSRPKRKCQSSPTATSSSSAASNPYPCATATSSAPIPHPSSAAKCPKSQSSPTENNDDCPANKSGSNNPSPTAFYPACTTESHSN